MTLPRKALAALAVVTAAGAVAVPAASASAATPVRTTSVRHIGLVPYTPPAYLCATLGLQVQGALAAHNPLLASLIVKTSVAIGCGGAAL